MQRGIFILLPAYLSAILILRRDNFRRSEKEASMRQLITRRRVLLPALLLFTAILILASRDRGVTIDFKGTALYHASPIDAVIETIPVSFHGQLRKGIYTGSCDIPGILQCDDLYVILRGDESSEVYRRVQGHYEPTPIHSITIDRTRCFAEIRLWTEYTVKNDRIFTTYDPLIHPVITITE